MKQLIKLIIFLTALSFAAFTYADVPVVDGYDTNANNPDDNPQVIVPAQNSSTANNNQAALMPAVSSSSNSSANVSNNASLPINERVTILERQVATLTQMLNQYNTLQTQLQDLRGQIEVEKHALKTLQAQVRSQYQDIDQRLAQAQNKNSITPATDKTPVAAVATAATNPTSTVAATTATNIAASTLATTVSDADADAYQAAFNLLKNKDYAKATTAFQKFVKQYPKSTSIINARYWLGQLYLLQGQPDKAIGQFHVILKTKPTDPKVPDTLLQLGLAYYAKGDLQRARTELNRVLQKYPGTNAAKLAQSRLQEIQSQLPANSGVATN